MDGQKWDVKTPNKVHEIKRFFWKDWINETVLIKEGLVDCVWFVSGQLEVIIDTAENTGCELETWNLSTCVARILYYY